MGQLREKPERRGVGHRLHHPLRREIAQQGNPLRWSSARARAGGISTTPATPVPHPRGQFHVKLLQKLSGGYLNFKAAENGVYISDDRPGARPGSRDNCSEPYLFAFVDPV